MKLRLLLLKECNRKCRGCCNKDWDLDALPVCNDFTPYSEFLLTGGEPLLDTVWASIVIRQIRNQNKSPIYLYTAKSDNFYDFVNMLILVDGITLTLHNQKDAENFKQLQSGLIAGGYLQGRSLRLNVFKGVSLKDINTWQWKIKKNITWIKDCPLPTNEVFMRT